LSEQTIGSGSRIREQTRSGIHTRSRAPKISSCSLTRALTKRRGLHGLGETRQVTTPRSDTTLRQIGNRVLVIGTFNLARAARAALGRLTLAADRPSAYHRHVRTTCWPRVFVIFRGMRSAVRTRASVSVLAAASLAFALSACSQTNVSAVPTSRAITNHVVNPSATGTLVYACGPVAGVCVWFPLHSNTIEGSVAVF